MVLQSLHEAGIVFVSETWGQSPMLYGCLSRPGARELGRPAERRPITRVSELPAKVHAHHHVDVSLTWSADCKENILESTFMVRGSLSLCGRCHSSEHNTTMQLNLLVKGHVAFTTGWFSYITCSIVQNST